MSNRPFLNGDYMEKLTKQSPLFNITKRINEIIDEINNNKDVYESLKPNITENIEFIIKDKDIPKVIEIVVAGLYKIELKSDKATVKLEIFRNNETKTLGLNVQNKVINDLLLSKGDKIIFKEANLETEDEILVNLDKNILEAFTEQYQLNKTNIETSTNISENIKQQFEDIKKVIAEFNYSINFEEVTDKELKELLSTLE